MFADACNAVVKAVFDLRECMDGVCLLLTQMIGRGRSGPLLILMIGPIPAFADLMLRTE